MTKLGLDGSKLITSLKQTLNHSQYDALLASAKQVCNGELPYKGSPFSLIQGPPGTGKTKVIVCHVYFTSNTTMTCS